MTDLSDFILARIAEDEAVANAETDWAVDPGLALSEVGEGMDMVRVRTITRHRLLAECEAKRRIIEVHGQLVVMPLIGPSAGVKVTTDDCSNCSSYDEDVARDECPTLRLLALPYADHPDYRDEWRQ